METRPSSGNGANPGLMMAAPNGVVTMKLRGIVINVNYPDDECEAAVPSNMTVDQLCEMIQKLATTEPDMTSFVITAAVDK